MTGQRSSEQVLACCWNVKPGHQLHVYLCLATSTYIVVWLCVTLCGCMCIYAYAMYVATTLAGVVAL